jgi:xanthine dehydrogenase iron-sulfur cluster and FAD-binding subunit A
MDAAAFLHEVNRLHNISDRLNFLAEQHPVVAEALQIISGNIRNTATLLEVLVITRIDPIADSPPANA